MIRTLAAAALIAASALAGAPAQAQNFLGMDLNRMNDDFNRRQNEQIVNRQYQIQQSVLNNPQAMAAYRAGVCGPGLTPQQFAYKYAALGGCTPQGYGNYMATSNGIAQQQANAWAGYQGAVQNRRDAMNGMFAGQQGIATDRGRLLAGCGYRTFPNGFTQWYCP